MRRLAGVLTGVAIVAYIALVGVLAVDAANVSGDGTAGRGSAPSLVPSSVEITDTGTVIVGEVVVPPPLPGSSGDSASQTGKQGLAAEGSDGDSAPGEALATAAANTVTVDAGNEWFGAPGFQGGAHELTVQVGDTVQWNILDGVHTVYECGDGWSKANTCAGATWSSDIVSAGSTFSQTFTAPGTVSYLCTIHPITMRGKIIVEAAAVVEEPPPQAPEPDPPAAVSPPVEQDPEPPTSPPPAPVTEPSTSPPPAPVIESSTSPPPAGPSPSQLVNGGFGPTPGAIAASVLFFGPVTLLAMAGLTFVASAVMLRNRSRAVEAPGGIQNRGAAAATSMPARSVGPVPARVSVPTSRPGGHVGAGGANVRDSLPKFRAVPWPDVRRMKS